MRNTLQPISVIPKRLNRKIGRAMHDFSMLSEGDRVLVAVSGGVDSLSLAWVLSSWQSKAPIRYSLKAVYIDNGFWSKEQGGSSPAAVIAELMSSLGIDFTAIKAREMRTEEFSCYLCARNRRSQLFDLCRDWKMNKIALGHHMDDLVETLFLNMMYSGNISTMVPSQTLFSGELQIIRPLAYLEKDEVGQIATLAGMAAVKNYCPLEKDTRRSVVREVLNSIYEKEQGAKQSIFRSLSNVRSDYTL